MQLCPIHTYATNYYAWFHSHIGMCFRDHTWNTERKPHLLLEGKLTSVILISSTTPQAIISLASCYTEIPFFYILCLLIKSKCKAHISEQHIYRINKVIVVAFSIKNYILSFKTTHKHWTMWAKWLCIYLSGFLKCFYCLLGF